ncbi:MAG: hypothetical protein K8J09_22320, partial [Planctomycetes bacterium]|nr:hypothetical protein [Planctomycetota bacterium]
MRDDRPDDAVPIDVEDEKERSKPQPGAEGETPAEPDAGEAGPGGGDGGGDAGDGAPAGPSLRVEGGGSVLVQDNLPDTMFVFPLRRAVPFPNLTMPLLLDSPTGR